MIGLVGNLPLLAADVLHVVTAMSCTRAGSEFHMEPGLTAVQILDYSMTGHVNLEADIRLPEPEGIVQVETFGVSINAYGTCYYGLQLEAVMDRCVRSVPLPCVPCYGVLSAHLL